MKCFTSARVSATSSVFSAMAAVGLMIVTYFSGIYDGLLLFLENQSLTLKNKSLEQDKQELTLAYKKYILLIQPKIIKAVSSNLKRNYQSGLQLCNQAIELKELHEWINNKSSKTKSPVLMLSHFSKESSSNTYWSRSTTIILKKSVCSYSPGTYRFRCRPISPSDFYKEKAEFFTSSKKPLTGINFFNKIKKIDEISLLLDNEQNKVRQFLNEYIEKREKMNIYNKKVEPILEKGWDHKKLKERAEEIKKNIEKMQDDLPKLESALERFFEQELIISK